MKKKKRNKEKVNNNSSNNNHHNSNQFHSSNNRMCQSITQSLRNWALTQSFWPICLRICVTS